MLELETRSQLLEILRPPPGYSFDRAIGTTFSLDLLTLLTVPLGFTFLTWGDSEERNEHLLPADPLALLQSLRRYAERIHLFCQAGQIHIPAAPAHPLFSHLEESVIEVQAPRTGGVFHPKLWALRFVHPSDPPRFRLLCLSRNLTFDRSWDTALVLEGRLTDRSLAFAKNHSLADFVAKLPDFTLRTLRPELRRDILELADELRRVTWEPPLGMTIEGFWPLGYDENQSWPFKGRTDRLLVVSPFLSDSLLDKLSHPERGDILISRLDSLSAMSQASLGGFQKVYSLDPSAQVEESDTPAPDVEPPLTGLHVKLYIAHRGWDAHIWTGSANATEAAFSRNVEFLIELSGRKSAFGIEAFLKEEKKQTTFSNLLCQFTASEEIQPKDQTEQQLEILLDEIRRSLVASQPSATITAAANDTYTTLVVCKQPLSHLLKDISVSCWPITLPNTLAQPWRPDDSSGVEFPHLSFEALTSFFAFKITAQKAGRTLAQQFVLNLPLAGAPEDRRGRLLEHMLKDRLQLLHLLLLMLSDEGPSAEDYLSVDSASSKASEWLSGIEGESLLEPLVRALARDPRRLDQIARLIEDLRKSERGSSLIPDRFEEVWRPVWTARKELQP